MHANHLVERFFETLITGDRPAARALVASAAANLSAQDMITDLFWPTYEMIERLHRCDQLSTLSHRLATRLLRVLVDQNAQRLELAASRGRTVFAVCGPADADEMGAQMAVDLLEAAGFSVTFAGGQIASDEILSYVNTAKPGVLLLFASGPSDLPGIREMIDTLREIGAASRTQVAVGGGVFNRAEGLAEEIGADLWASCPFEMVDKLTAEPARRADDSQRTVGKNRRKAA